MEKKQLSFGYIKAEGIGTQCELDTYALIHSHGLKIIHQEDVFMHYATLREHQPILFDLKGDLNDIWKIQGAGRLIGSTIRAFIVSGENAIKKLYDIKLEIRQKYALPREFDRDNEISYPNYIHAGDNYEQVEQDIRVLIPSKLKLCQEVNGIHPISVKTW